MRSLNFRSENQAGDSKGLRGIGWWMLGLLGVYLLGYVVLCPIDYFDLATLPWGSGADNWLDKIYRPMERLRR